MGWIKRNLYFTILGVIALALLGWAIYYNIKSWSNDNSALANVKQDYDQLAQLYRQTPTPAETNIVIEKLQKQQLQDWIDQARAHFVPILPIPNPSNGVVTMTALSESLGRTIHEMQVEAQDANVELPAEAGGYSFSFAAERNQLTFSPGSLDAMASHLGQVKAICEVMFDAKVNGIDSIQREVISDNDAAGAQSDYLTEKTKTVGSATLTPYAITFRCFSADLGNVLSKFASSNHGFIVTGINVMPAEGLTGQGGSPQPNEDGSPNPNGGLQTVLDEQLLRVSLGLEVVTLTKQ